MSKGCAWCQLDPDEQRWRELPMSNRIEKPTNFARFFISAYTVWATTVIDVSVFGDVYKEVKVYGELVARVPEDRFFEWLVSETSWIAGDPSTVTIWEKEQ